MLRLFILIFFVTVRLAAQSSESSEFLNLKNNFSQISLIEGNSATNFIDTISFANAKDLLAGLQGDSDITKDPIRSALYFTALPEQFKHLAVQFEIENAPGGRLERGSAVRILNPKSAGSPPSQIYRETLNINISSFNKDMKFMSFRDTARGDSLWQFSPFTDSVRRLDQANRQDALLGGSFSLNDIYVWSENPSSFEIINFADEQGLVLTDSQPWQVIEREGCIQLNASGVSEVYNYQKSPVKKVKLFSKDLYTKYSREMVTFLQNGLPVSKNLFDLNNEIRQTTYGVLREALLKDGRRLWFYSAVYIFRESGRSVIKFNQVNFCPNKTAELGFAGIDPSNEFANSKKVDPQDN